ncbi:MAG: glycosyltransferase family 61 protein [Methylacidiphilales bacterium]|nr:glycosyltransferase family 61 protein [Candidatus Methylacidiphilales bacterium]
MRFDRLHDQAKSLIKWLFKPVREIKWLSDPIRRQFHFTDFVSYHQAAKGKNTRNLRVLLPAQRVTISYPATDPFVPVGKLYREGWFDRPDIFVCEVPGAHFYVYDGIICTRDLEVLCDIEPRIPQYRHHIHKKPRAVRKGLIRQRAGLYSSINAIAAGNHYHWMVDALPKIHSLAKYEPKEKVTIVMPDTIGPVQKETLACVLPANFQVEYHPRKTWLHFETFLLPSLVSGYYNAFLPAEYYESIRRPIFERFHLPAVHTQTERLYLSRRGARLRRVLNEEAVVALLQPYGFKTVELEKLSFREQVELFHRADILVGPSGAAFNVLMFCGKVRAVVLHPNQVPENFFHTLAHGLGQDYHFVLHHEGNDDDFEVNLGALKRVLDEELSLRSS